MDTSNTVDRVNEDEVKFVSLQFSDLLGVVKEIIIPASRIESALKSGVWFDGSSIEGFARIQESDLYLKPDPATYSLVPWLSGEGKTARLICDIYSADAKPFDGDPRYVLKKVLAEAAEMGLEYNVGPEPEFYLFNRDQQIRTIPVDQASYFDLSTPESYSTIREIVNTLTGLGISVEASHHEVGRGQYEVDFQYATGLHVADKLLTLKYAVKKIAQLHGLHATFMPKPIMGAPGSGLHVHQSLFDQDGNNAFFEESDKYRLSKMAYNFIAGQIEHIKALCAVLCPTVNSYKRLVSGFEAPVYITWASMNRSALIRVPRWFEKKPKSARIELRCPDPSCNPYLAFAVMLKAGLDGIRNNLVPPEPVEENVYQLDSQRLTSKHIDTLPASLWEALNELMKDKLVREALGANLFEKYVNVKKREWDEFRIQVTPWEQLRYLDIY